MAFNLGLSALASFTAASNNSLALTSPAFTSAANANASYWVYSLNITDRPWITIEFRLFLNFMLIYLIINHQFSIKNCCLALINKLNSHLAATAILFSHKKNELHW